MANIYYNSRFDIFHALTKLENLALLKIYLDKFSKFIIFFVYTYPYYKPNIFTFQKEWLISALFAFGD